MGSLQYCNTYLNTIENNSVIERVRCMYFHKKMNLIRPWYYELIGQRSVKIIRQNFSGSNSNSKFE